MFNPGLSIGQILKNADLVDKFKCANMGGMRRSKATNTLVIISDYTKGIYHDKWIGGVLHYTGMGKSGDQNINWAQNATLAGCGRNGVDVHLFEVIDAGDYIYCGRIELVQKPYTEVQPGEDGIDRKVWMFPIRPIPDNDVKKPAMFVFDDMEDYKTRGKNVEKEYAKVLGKRKKLTDKKNTPVILPVPSNPGPKTPIVVPAKILGKTVSHKVFGNGKIIEISGGTIAVNFDNVGIKKLSYEYCVQNSMLEFI